jgi:subtilisin-like proprotein convertase family protein
MERTFELALDEAVAKAADGKESALRLDPPATPATLPARLAALSTGGLVVSPVCYEEGRPREPRYRRIITREITVRLPDGAAAPALPAGVALKERPAYAPDFAVLTAADPFAALAALQPLRSLPGILSAEVQLATQRALKAMPNDPLVGDQWHLKNNDSARTHVNVENAWLYGASGGVKGNGIRIGIVDDGLQTNHPDLSANVDTVNDYDWNDATPSDPSPGDGDDHGTACAGNAAARGNNGVGVSGTAPEATLVGMRLIAAATTDSQEAAAMAYLPALIQVKSNSWGPDDDGLTLEAPGTLTRAALANAAATGRGGLGTIFLWAGGNGRDVDDNSNYDGYANDIHTIAVGACDSEGGQSWYSESGANLVVVAPSSGDVLGITTTDRTGAAGYASGDYADDFGGTSSATPTAAGVVALMLEKNAGLGWRDVQEILIRSAYKFAPGDADWTDNSAGLHFNHKYGAGLIDATAAVALAGTWTNLAAATSQTVSQTGLSVAIPDNDAAGITRSFDFSGSNLRVEHVTVEFAAAHSYRGDLEVTLTSPSGMVSRLAELHADDGNNYGTATAGWKFSSVRHWGENSAGTWTLKVADRDAGTTGTLQRAVITLHGTPAAPINPAPVVAITSPSAGAVFSPGAEVTVTVNASDLNADGSPGTVAAVQLFDHGTPVGTDASAPYSFTLTPATGDHSFTAVATDGEGATSTSGAVAVTVVNQPPVITAASISPAGQAYDDEPLSVTGVIASDPEGQPLTFGYAWESSADGVNWSPSGDTGATLPAAPANSARLWRCQVTASDGNSSSATFSTAAVNLLVRPPATAANGQPFSYDSGLVLRGTDSPVDRDVIVNEFSQGVAGSSEWVELLVLKEVSLRGWKLADSSGNRLTFADTSGWDAVPAGTLLVIYNGASRDSLLPADDADLADLADQRGIFASSDASRFTGSWPGFGNGGDAVILLDPADTVVAGISYGTSNATAPYLGSLGSGSAAYYAGSSDAGATDSAGWTVTTSQVARRTPRAPGDLFISEYVEGSSNNKALELYNPAASAVDLAAEGYKVEIYSNGSSAVGTTINLAGTIPAGGTFVLKNTSASAAITAQQSSGGLTFNGDDAVVLRKGTSVIDAIGRIGFDPGTAWGSGDVLTADRTLRRKSTVTTGDTVASDAFDPTIEWDGFPQDDFTGLGSHSIGGGGAAITLAVSPATFAENAGSGAATGTVTLSAAAPVALEIALLSSDPSAATVPASVTVAAGEASASFSIAAVDDAVPDGAQSVVITASADGYSAGSFGVTVSDDEPSLNGVTPAAGNTAANAGFVADLRSGALNAPALFRFGASSQTPAGLVIDPSTGVVSGTPAAAEGSYAIVIERYNTLGEVVSQSFSLAISGGTGGYAGWIAAYPTLEATGQGDDPDFDGMENLLEYYLGAHPGQADAAEHLPVLVKSGSTLTLTWWRSKTADGVTATAEWSATLGSWSTAGISTAVIADEASRERLQATLVAGATDARLFLRLRVE